jgi:tricorn protease-like protein
MKYDLRHRRPNLFSQRKPRGPLLPISVLAVALLVALFSLIRPFQPASNFNPSNVTVPAFTPTPTAVPTPTSVHGGHIVFTCTRKDINQICMIRSDGSGYAQLTHETNNGYYPAISPDLKAVVFALNQYDLFNLNVLTLRNNDVSKLADQIGNSFSPDFSPDGRQIVFVNRVGNAPSALWVIDSDGRDPHQLYAGPKDIVGAAWSHDGAWIAFTMEVDTAYTYEVFLLDVRHPEAAPRRISHGLGGIGGSLDWAPDGSNLVIFAGPVQAREIYRLDVPSGKATQLTHGGNNAAPSYSPDGQYIVFNSLRNNNQADLYIMRADGHSQRQLTTNPEPDWQPQWGN